MSPSNYTTSLHPFNGSTDEPNILISAKTVNSSVETSVIVDELHSDLLVCQLSCCTANCRKSHEYRLNIHSTKQIYRSLWVMFLHRPFTNTFVKVVIFLVLLHKSRTAVVDTLTPVSSWDSPALPLRLFNNSFGVVQEWRTQNWLFLYW